MIAQENQNVVDSESEFIASSGSLELNGSSWVYVQVSILNIDLQKNVTDMVVVILNYPIKTCHIQSSRTKMIFNVEFGVK